MRVFGSYKYDFNGRKRKPKKPKGEVCVKYVPPKFSEYNQVRRMQANVRQRQNATNRHLLLQQRQEATSENLPSTPETMSLESDSFIKVTLSQ